MPSKTSVDENFVEDVVQVLDQQKAENIDLYDVRGKITYTDFIVIATANSGMHAKALTKYLMRYLKDLNIDPINQTKKIDTDTWIVLDYGELVVHIFQEMARLQYNLEEIYQRSQKEG